MSIIKLITEVATNLGYPVSNNGRDLTILTDKPCKLTAMIVCTAFEREGMEIGKLISATMVDAVNANQHLMQSLNSDGRMLIDIEITTLRTMPFDEIRQLA
jgi:hypothetical protein